MMLNVTGDWLRRRVSGLLCCGALAGSLAIAVPARAQEMRPEVEEHVKKAAVMVFVARSEKTKGDKKMGSGSGFFLNSTGLASTNNHVVDPMHLRSKEEKQRFHYQAGRLTWTIIKDAGTDDEQEYEAIVIYQNETADQALMQVLDEDGEKLETPNYLRLLPESRLATRMPLWALGWPGGDRETTDKDKHPIISIDFGHVLQIPRTPAGRVRMIYTDVRVRPGNSGGAMVNVDGFVVGTGTLMTAPEGFEDTGGANYAALVPAKITGQMIRNAFRKGKMAQTSDFKPLMGLLVDDSGRLDLPSYKRQSGNDVLFYENGDRIYGKVATEKISWESPMGTFEIPTDAIAYVMNNEEGSTLFLEGGNRIEATDSSAQFEFKANGAEAVEDLDEVQVVGFQTDDRELETFQGKVIAVDTNAGYLLLQDVKGAAKFDSRVGLIEIPLEELERIETHEEDDDKQVIWLEDGRRLSGNFTEDLYEATIAATGTPISFHLANVRTGIVEIFYRGMGGLAGLDLVGVLQAADGRIKRIAKDLENGKIKRAQTRLAKYLEPNKLRELNDTKSDQIKFLDGVAKLRAGKYEDARRSLRKSRNSANKNIGAYADACVTVLKEFNTAYENKPLSDPEVFADAGTELAWGMIGDVRDILKDARRIKDDEPAKTRGEYSRAMGNIDRHVERMWTSAIFVGSDADDEVIRLWKYGLVSCMREIGRIDQLLGNNNQGRGARGAQPARGQRRLRQREREDLGTKREDAIATYRKLVTDLRDYGFRIDDQDIQEWREKSDQPEGEPEPEKPDDENP